MAKVLYGVAGEGYGHSSRSEIIGRRLLEAGHEVRFAASGKSLSYLAPLFPGRVHEVFGLQLVYCHGAVQPIKTIGQNIKEYRAGSSVNQRLFEMARQFEPDLVISDFEPFCGWWAFRRRIPCVYIDHQHILTLARLEGIPRGWGRLQTDCVVRAYHSFAQCYVGINFFRVEVKTPRLVPVNPVVRRQVMELSPTYGDHILVYVTDSRPETQQYLIQQFGPFCSYHFHIYGFHVEQEHGNCIFRKTSTDGFLQDLSSCAGVIATAGFSLISECLYLKKRMLLMPIKGQFEQQVNAIYAERLGFARNARWLELDSLKLFLKDIEREFPRDDRILWPDNERFFNSLDHVLRTNRIYLGLNRTTAGSLCNRSLLS
jgi:uncharacterized protein (TIGR00661 family)